MSFKQKKRLKNITNPAVIGLLLLVPGRYCLLGESRGYNDFKNCNSGKDIDEVSCTYIKTEAL